MPKGEYLQYGGQAIIEGVMMRSPRYFSVACRAPNGEIVHQTEAIEATWIGRQKWLKLPLLRGSLALLDSMALGNKALRYASNVQIDPKLQPVIEGEKPDTSNLPSQKIQDASVWIALILGLAVGLAIFNLVPNLISAAASNWLHVEKDWKINLITEAIKVSFFLGYLWLIGQFKEIKRIFMYHGAEHQAINTMEAEQELTIDNCLKQTRLHPRCGTSFAIIVLIVSIILFTFVPRPHGYSPAIIGIIRFFVEIPLLLVVAGISYELLRVAGKFRNTTFVKFAFWPGLMSQYLTTRQPDAAQTEVALVALKEVLAAEERGGAPAATREDALESAPPIPIP